MTIEQKEYMKRLLTPTLGSLELTLKHGEKPKSLHSRILIPLTQFEIKEIEMKISAIKQNLELIK